MPDDVLRLVSRIGELDVTVESLLPLVQHVKEVLQDDDYGISILESLSASPWIRPPRMDEYLPQVGDDFAGGNHWLADLQNLAADQGNPWVPTQGHDLLGVDMSGIWRASLDEANRTYIRQFGPYINLVMGLTGEPQILAEGLYDPFHSRIAFVGRTLIGARCTGFAQLQKHWVLDGEIETTGFFGTPEGELLVLEKIG